MHDHYQNEEASRLLGDELWVGMTLHPVCHRIHSAQTSIYIVGRMNSNYGRVVNDRCCGGCGIGISLLDRVAEGGRHVDSSPRSLVV
jgi:hypothetical protein